MSEETARGLSEDEYLEIIAKQRALIELLTDQVERSEIFKNNFLNTKETAIILDVKPRTVRLYNRMGKITGRKYKKEGRLFFSLKRILAFRKEHLKHWAFFD